MKNQTIHPKHAFPVNGERKVSNLGLSDLLPDKYISPDRQDQRRYPYSKNLYVEHQARIDQNHSTGREKLSNIGHELDHVQKTLAVTNKKRVKKELHKLDEQQAVEEESIITQTDREIDALISGQSIDAKQKDELKARMTRDAVCDSLNRYQLDVMLKPYWLYLLLLVIIGLCEAPLNYTSFVILRESKVMTLIMSLVLIITLPFMSHTMGKIFKRRHEKSKVYVPMMVLIGILVLVITGVTAELRGHYLSNLDVPDNELFTDKALFFVVGIILFLVGSIASFFSHDASSSLQKAFRNWEVADRIYRKAQKVIDKKVDKRMEKKSVSLNQVEEEFCLLRSEVLARKDTLNKRKELLKAQYNRELLHYRKHENCISTQYKKLASDYLEKKSLNENNYGQLPDLHLYFDKN